MAKIVKSNLIKFGDFVLVDTGLTNGLGYGIVTEVINKDSFLVRYTPELYTDKNVESKQFSYDKIKLVLPEKLEMKDIKFKWEGGSFNKIKKLHLLDDPDEFEEQVINEYSGETLFTAEPKNKLIPVDIWSSFKQHGKRSRWRIIVTGNVWYQIDPVEGRTDGYSNEIDKAIVFVHNKEGMFEYCKEESLDLMNKALHNVKKYIISTVNKKK